ncbi:MAG: hypothetical protein ACI9UJ_001780 [bacterium]|jgi:hypothetical protein
MTKHDSDKMPVDVLQCLFDILSKQIDPKINPVLQIADDLNLSKESVYRRFRAESAFTLQELWLLSQSYTMPLDVLFSNGQSNKISLRLVGANTASFHNYMNEMYAILLRCNLSQPNQYFYFANAIPLHYIIQNKTLSRLKFLLWNHLFGVRNGINADAWNFERKVEQTFCVNEVWSKQVTEVMIQELDFVLACGVTVPIDFLFQWYKALSELIKSRLFNDDSFSHDLYESEIGIPTTVVTRFKPPSDIIVVFSDVFIGYTINPEHQLTFGNWAKNILKHCIKLSGQSARLKHSFYLALIEPIQVSSSKRLTPELYNELKQLLDDL